MEKEAIRGLAVRGVDLWLNLELSKFKKDDNYTKVTEFLKQRFKAENLNPLLLTLGLLEMALIEDALKGKSYFTEEEREKVIQEVVDNLAKNFPQVVEEMEKILENLSSKINEFREYVEKYKSGGE